MPENRQLPRHRKRIRVQYGPERLNHTGFTEDISNEGFFLKTALVLRPGTILQAEIELPGGMAVSLEGRVRWSKKVPPALLRRLKGGMGVKIRRFYSGESAYQAYCSELASRY